MAVPKSLCSGARVEIHSLVGAPQHNGRWGTIVGKAVQSADRWRVQCDADDDAAPGNAPLLLDLRPANLKLGRIDLRSGPDVTDDAIDCPAPRSPDPQRLAAEASPCSRAVAAPPAAGENGVPPAPPMPPLFRPAFERRNRGPAASSAAGRTVQSVTSARPAARWREEIDESIEGEDDVGSPAAGGLDPMEMLEHAAHQGAQQRV
eukprot:gnl/TRDRNA2_/TRDRNA2_156226_c0_seq1.p1 gnl/TRDRNA2_/TRDRNA2_156226_c0~~gnl/TRDRNA2_/TRDRNA2_156226_c0_seq1.p1  ORF type:complete len:205 (+),score=36.38 gnl/TRDRNA2_/TRDRNA2_156226_c0_seq1:146-760(+)